MILRARLVRLFRHHLSQLERWDIRPSRPPRRERFSLPRLGRWPISRPDIVAEVPPAAGTAVAIARSSRGHSIIPTAGSSISAPVSAPSIVPAAAGASSVPASVAAAPPLILAVVAPRAVVRRAVVPALRGLSPPITIGRRGARRAGARARHIDRRGRRPLAPQNGRGNLALLGLQQAQGPPSLSCRLIFSQFFRGPDLRLAPASLPRGVEDANFNLWALYGISVRGFKKPSSKTKGASGVKGRSTVGLRHTLRRASKPASLISCLRGRDSTRFQGGNTFVRLFTPHARVFA